MPLYQDENAALSQHDRTIQPPDLLARSGLPVPVWQSAAVSQFNADFRRLVARISSLFAMIAPTAQGAPESTSELAIAAHVSQHQAGGSDELNVQDLHGLLGDDQHPLPHDIQGDRHTASGLVPGYVLRATAPDAFFFQALQNSDLPPDSRLRTIEFQGADIPSLSGGDFFSRVPYSCTLVRWSVFADAVGNLQLDVLRSTIGSFPPSTSLVGGGNKPALVASQADSQAPSGWTDVALVAGDVIAIHHVSSSGINRGWLVLDVVV